MRPRAKTVEHAVRPRARRNPCRSRADARPASESSMERAKQRFRSCIGSIHSYCGANGISRPLFVAVNAHIIEQSVLFATSTCISVASSPLRPGRTATDPGLVLEEIGVRTEVDRGTRARDATYEFSAPESCDLSFTCIPPQRRATPGPALASPPAGRRASAARRPA